MFSNDHDQQRAMEDAKRKFQEYSALQKDFQLPQTRIEIDDEANDATRVHMETEFNGIPYKFESIQEKDIDDVYNHLNSQPLVREKYADGIVQTREATAQRIRGLTQRFRDKKSPSYLYSAFIVSDGETENFLGFVNLGVGMEPGTAEMARLNRVECWSRPPTDVVAKYEMNGDKNIFTRLYSGIGTAETCTLLKYGAYLKQKGYLINGLPLRAVVATARVDNEGSWKSNAKAGMKLQNVNSVERYGKVLRYHLQKDV